VTGVTVIGKNRPDIPIEGRQGIRNSCGCQAAAKTQNDRHSQFGQDTHENKKNSAPPGRAQEEPKIIFETEFVSLFPGSKALFFQMIAGAADDGFGCEPAVSPSSSNTCR